MNEKEEFYNRLKSAFKIFKKEICFSLIVLSILLEVLPANGLLKPEASLAMQMAAILSLLIILIGVLFDIFSKVNDNNKLVSIVESGDLLPDIHKLVKNEKEVNIKYIAVAGVTGWGTVLSRFLDKTDRYCLLDKKIKIDIAVIDTLFLSRLENSKDRYSSVINTIKEVELTKRKLDSAGIYNVEINVFQYNYMPNFVGYLVNDNYLFTTLAYWEVEDGSNDSLVLRGGRRSHIVYDKNDDFGGAYYINKFKGWFDYIKLRGNSVEIGSCVELSEEKDVV